MGRPDDGGRALSRDQAAGILRDKLAELGDSSATIVQDPTAYAAYRFGGNEQPITVIACPVCRHVALMPALPAKPQLVWTCPSGHRYSLTPPLEVLRAAFGLA